MAKNLEKRIAKQERRVKRAKLSGNKLRLKKVTARLEELKNGS